MPFSNKSLMSRKDVSREQFAIATDFRLLHQAIPLLIYMKSCSKYSGLNLD
ncbi:CyaY protein [Kingella kingae ATCC 23330]|uniref:CyaY protein n=1 Tax=Kingella kingae ATCC 23330 TaxID=887327 RepID=F5S4X7_KINKI|nr:CyaY protein [Kingella kingae ATCC 23330]